jgi:ADP-ribose pyrophosphatase YjhB (NUDIX family)
MEQHETVSGITSSIIPHYYADETCYVLIGKRKDTSKAYPGYWCLVGGFLNPRVETLEHTASRELQEETGIVARPDVMKLVTIQSEPDRDPRGHVIDTVWSVLLEGEVDAKASDDLADLQWLPIEEALVMQLAFDHEQSLYLFGVQEGIF